jgi:peptide/nickel transport system permease protein
MTLYYGLIKVHDYDENSYIHVQYIRCLGGILDMKDRMLTYFAKRIIQVPLIVFIVVTMGFIILKLAPGDPVAHFAGEGASPEYLEMVRRAYGLDKPILEQYMTYITGIFTGNWGYSPSFERPVLTVIMERLPLTLILSLAAFILALPLGVLLGMTAALKRRSLIDSFIRSFATFFNAIPAFIIGLLLLFTFSVNMRLLPIGGFQTIGITHTSILDRIIDILQHIILPATSLMLIWMVDYTRVMRNKVIEALLSDYTRAAVSRGIKWRRILFRHVLRNSILPVVTLAGVQVGYMLGGVILTETVFSWPGIGMLIVQAVSYRDYPLLMGVLFISSLWVSITNIVIDIIYMILDPRVRLQ